MSAKEKKGSGGIILVVVLLLIIAAMLLFLFGDGFGFGSGGNGFGNDAVPVEGSVSETENTDSDTTSETVSEINYVDVTVSESRYLYQNNSYELSDLIEALKANEGEIEVHITIDESAAANAYDDLKAALDENGIPYAVDTAATEQDG